MGSSMAEPEAPIAVLMDMGSEEKVALLSALAANTRRSIAEKASPAKIQSSRSAVAITTSEGIDGYRAKAMRIASVE